MSQQNLDAGSTASFLHLLNGTAIDMNVDTLSGDITLDGSSASAQALDPDGAGRTITLEDLSSDPEALNGQMFVIINTADAAEDLTINDGVDDSTVATVGQGDMGFFFWDAEGEAWVGASV